MQLDDVDNEAFGAFVAYLYSGKLDLSTLSLDTLFALIRLSEFFAPLGTTELAASVRDYLHAHVSVESACQLFELATRFGESALRDECEAFVDKHLERIVEANGHVRLSFPSLTAFLSKKTNWSTFSTSSSKMQQQQRFDVVNSWLVFNDASLTQAHKSVHLNEILHILSILMIEFRSIQSFFRNLCGNI